MQSKLVITPPLPIVAGEVVDLVPFSFGGSVVNLSGTEPIGIWQEPEVKVASICFVELLDDVALSPKLGRCWESEG